MISSVAKLDFVSAFHFNPFLFITGPFILAYIACSEIKYIVSGSGRLGKFEIFIWVELALAISYTILRNIYHI